MELPRHSATTAGMDHMSRQRRGRTLHRCLVIWALCLGSCLGARAEDHALQQAAVVQIGGCSGVCVDPDGLVMTAKHCDLGDVETVRFSDLEVLATKIYESTASEGPVVYDCVGSGYPFVQVASSVPPRGTRVFTMGFPHVDGARRFREQEGKVLSGGEFRFRGEMFRGNLTDMSIREGWSGGPLFNPQGEVIGLANASDKTGSIFISFAATRAAYDAVHSQHVQRVTLRVVTDLYSRQCLKFLGDYAGDAGIRSELQEHFHVMIVDAGEHPELLQRYGVTDLPAFIVGDAVTVSGYADKVQLLQTLLKAASQSGLAAQHDTDEHAGELH